MLDTGNKTPEEAGVGLHMHGRKIGIQQIDFTTRYLSSIWNTVSLGGSKTVSSLMSSLKFYMLFSARYRPMGST
jgi:hypothetical protein